MKVIKSEDSYVQFDNGLELIGDGDVDCCAYNYLDFDQLPIGTELETMTAKAFIKAATIKDDGFSIKDTDGVPKWVQARTEQNGYYSSMTTFRVAYKGESLEVGEFHGEDS